MKVIGIFFILIAFGIVLSQGNTNEDFNKEADDLLNTNIKSIIQELNWADKTELTKDEFSILLKKVIHHESHGEDQEDMTAEDKNNIEKMFMRLEEKILETIPDKIKVDDLAKYLSSEEINKVFEELIETMTEETSEMVHGQGKGENESFADMPDMYGNEDL